MFEIRLINPLRQFGTVCWTLVFNDPSGDLPDCRIDKKFPDEMEQSAIVEDVRQTLTAAIFEATRPPMEYDETGEPLPQADGIVVDLDGSLIDVYQVGGAIEQWQM